MNKSDKLTKHFAYKEFFSGDIKLGHKSIEPPGKYYYFILVMAESLQIVRDYIGSPIIITSGYRTPKWNSYVGGVKNSYHTTGRAVDIRVSGMTPYDLAVYVSKLTEFKGFGICLKKNFLHCDMRDKFMVFQY